MTFRFAPLLIAGSLVILCQSAGAATEPTAPTPVSQTSVSASVGSPTETADGKVRTKSNQTNERVASKIDGNAVKKIEGTVKSVDAAKGILVVVSASGQEYVLPYLEQPKAPIVVGQKVSIYIKVCYKAHCFTIDISA